MKLDDYTLTKFLGKGTFGEVYLTQRDNDAGRYYATKRMNKQMVDDPRYSKYFRNEITVLKGLNHPNIIRLQDLKQTKNHYYIIMEYCNGGSLGDCLKKYRELYHHAFTEEIVQYIMRQIMSAVKYIHSNGYIHRDLKLDNILVNFFNQQDYNIMNLLKAQVKIIDFGFASSRQDNHLYSTAIGSPLNMDPLILKKFTAGKAQTNDLCYDEKADIWSIGALCYEMLIGNSPFDSYNMKELVEKIEIGNYKLPTNLSREIVSFLNAMLQYDPAKRMNAQSLFNHAFLTKNVRDFQRINTNLISKNVYGGQLNINIKNNQSIWAIFNEADQRKFDNIPSNYFQEGQTLSESLYLPTTDNGFGISPNPVDDNKKFVHDNFKIAASVPDPFDNLDQNKINNSSISTKASGGLNPNPPFDNNKNNYYQQPPPQQNQYNQNNKINNQQKDTHIITFRNEIFIEPKPNPMNKTQFQYQQPNPNMVLRPNQPPNYNMGYPPQYKNNPNLINKQINPRMQMNQQGAYINRNQVQPMYNPGVNARMQMPGAKQVVNRQNINIQPQQYNNQINNQNQNIRGLPKKNQNPQTPQKNVQQKNFVVQNGVNVNPQINQITPSKNPNSILIKQPKKVNMPIMQREVNPIRKIPSAQNILVNQYNSKMDIPPNPININQYNNLNTPRNLGPQVNQPGRRIVKQIYTNNQQKQVVVQNVHFVRKNNL